MPRVSILLTCYNHIRYLPACVEGIRKQTFRDFEIVAIDDGSQDFSREWLAEQPDIRCIFNAENLGTYETLNVGLRSTSGEFVAVLNDDDLWEPEKLERQIGLMEAHPKVGVVHTGGTFIDGEGKTQEGNPLGFAFPRFETGDVLLGLVYENKVIASAALARRECFDKVGEFNRQYFGSGDWEMWFRIAEQFDFGFIDAPLTHYRVHGANASHKLERIWRDDEMLRTWMAPRLENLGSRFSSLAIRRARAFNYAALGTVQTLNGRPADGRQSYGASARLNPLRWKTYARYLATYLSPTKFQKLL